MKFRCERDRLAEAIGTAARAVSSRGGSLPVLSGVRLELTGNDLVLTGSDLDLTISVTVEVAGDGDGVIVLPARVASEIVRSVESGAVELVTEESEARISAGRSQFALRVIPAEEFPQLAAPEGEAVTLTATEFAEALGQVVPAASDDDARPILTGVLLAAEQSGLRVVATDSYRLAVRDLPGASVLDEGQTVLLPSRALKELVKLLGEADDVVLQLGERDASFEVGATRLTTRLIEGEFPNYRSLIPSGHPNTLVIDRAVLLDAVRRVRIMAQEATPIRLVQKSGTLELMAVSHELGQAHEEVDAQYDGDELTVAFNPDFLIAGLEAAPGDEVTLESVDALKPALLRSSGDEDFLYLLMPVRVP